MASYNGTALGYNNLHKEEQLKKSIIVKDNLVVKKTDKLLDVGCGTGISSDFDCEVYAIDPSQKMLDLCPLINKLLGSAENIPYPDNFFDIVISITAAHNFKNIEKSMIEIKRVGKKKFVFSVLKKSKKFLQIKKEIKNNFKIKKEIEEAKDVIFFVE